jgi:ribosomal-protein-alanine N-acetyltransferase
MVERASGAIIGRCGLHNWNVAHQPAEIGYNITRDDFKQQGFMTEAVAAILAHGFETLQLNRIETIVGEHNTPSLRIIHRFKFVQEGILRQHWLVGDAFEDSIAFSLLQSEYRAPSTAEPLP